MLMFAKMIERDIPKQPATPAQAGEMFTRIGELTTLKGKNYGDTHAFSEVPVTVPDEVAAHFPVPDDISLEVRRTVYVTQKFDRTTGEPERSGVVGMVTFAQKDHRDAGLIYATHVNYHVITDDGKTHRLERHVTNTEHGPHRVAQEAGKVVTRQSMLDKLAELTALRDRVDATRGMEQSLGLLTVSQPEADQILNVLADLNGQTS